MKKVVKLTENDLIRIVKQTIKENDGEKFGFDNEEEYLIDFEKADNYAGELYYQMIDEIDDRFLGIISGMDFSDIIERYKNKFKRRYGKYKNVGIETINENITDLMSLKTEPIDIENYMNNMLDGLYKTIDGK